MDVLSTLIKEKNVKDSKIIATTLCIAYYNMAVELEHSKDSKEALNSYEKGLALANQSLNFDHPIIKSLERAYEKAKTQQMRRTKYHESRVKERIDHKTRVLSNENMNNSHVSSWRDYHNNNCRNIEEFATSMRKKFDSKDNPSIASKYKSYFGTLFPSAKYRIKSMKKDKNNQSFLGTIEKRLRIKPRVEHSSRIKRKSIINNLSDVQAQNSGKFIEEYNINKNSLQKTGIKNKCVYNKIIY